jgi:hypothetical protein
MRDITHSTATMLTHDFISFVCLHVCARAWQMLNEGKFTREKSLRAEWLALVLELDRTADGKGETAAVNEDYAWYALRTEPSYVNTLLERRTEMLRLNLTETPSLQVRQRE